MELIIIIIVLLFFFLEFFLLLLTNYLKKNFQWLITEKDEYPEFSKKKISVEALPKGLYTIQFLSKGKTVMKRIVKK